MQTKEVARILRSTADILDHYEGKNLDSALNEILSLIKKNSKSQRVEVKKVSMERNTSDGAIGDFQHIIDILSKKQGKEIEEYLTNDKFLNTKKSLLALAKEMSIACSSRQTKDVIKHSIIKYFERQKMDYLIRIERQ
jgi:hypothetical protein